MDTLPAFRFVTGSLHVDYLKPTPLAGELELRGRVKEIKGRKVVVETTVLAGGGVRGGMTYGKSDRHAAFPAADPVSPTDLIATVYHLLGVPDGQSLPDVGGRPHFVRPGRVIRDLMA